jgi:hypothetical protein
MTYMFRSRSQAESMGMVLYPLESYAHPYPSENNTHPYPPKTHGHALQGNSGRIDKTCPNQGVLKYRNLTDFCHFGQITVNSDIFLSTFCHFGQFSINFCSLGYLDSDMFLSIRPLFPCSDGWV